MSASLYAGAKFAMRHRWITLITALAIAVPLLVTVLGVIADRSSRPSDELQRIAVGGRGASRVMQTTTAIGAGNDDTVPLHALDRIAPGVFRKVDSVQGVPATSHGSAYLVTLDQRDWTDPLFDNMLQAVSGRLPAAADEVALSPSLSARMQLVVGDQIGLAGSNLTIVGIYQRPYALRAELVFVPRNTALRLQVDQFQAVLTSYIGTRELSAAESAQLDPAKWSYFTRDQFVTKVSYLSKAPLGYGLVLLVSLVGIVVGAWALTSRRRRAASRTMARLGAGRSLMIGAAVVEAMCGVVVGTLLATIALAVAGPVTHRMTAAAAGIIPESGWFPWPETVLVVCAAAIMVGLTAALMTFQSLRATTDRSPATLSGTTLESRVRRGARTRSLFMLFGVLAAVIVASATSVIWLTGNESDRLANPGTRRPGDIEVYLDKYAWNPGLASDLVAEFPGPSSRVQELQPSTWAGGIDGTDVLKLADPRAPQLAGAPVQVVTTKDDWLFLTGRQPSSQEWTDLLDGKIAIFDPDLASSKQIDVSVSNSSVSTTKVLVPNAPHFDVGIDGAGLNRAKGAVGPTFAARHGLRVVDRSILVHTDLADEQATEAAVGRIVLQNGLTGTNIRIGRPLVPSPPLMVIPLTYGPAILAAELAVFSILAASADERRTRRLLTALGARFRRRFTFIFGISGVLAVVAAIVGLAVGIAFGSALTATWNGWQMVRIPAIDLLGLGLGLVILSTLTCALVAGQAAEGRAGRA